MPSVTKAPVAVGRDGAASTVDVDATRVAIDARRCWRMPSTPPSRRPAISGVPSRSRPVWAVALPHLLQRPYQDGAHDRRPGGRAGCHAGGRVRRPCHQVAVAFQEARVSGISVGVPGTPQTWQTALRKWGTISLRDALRPAIKVANRASWSTRRSSTRSTRTSRLSRSSAPPARCICRAARHPGLDLPQPRSRPDLSPAQPAGRCACSQASWQPTSCAPCSTRQSSRHRTYRGRSRSARASWKPPTWPVTTSVRRGRPIMRYRGYDVFGMPTPSSGGSTVGEGLNIVENWDLGDLSQTQALHRYLEASALAFADRNRYVGDNTPRALLDELLNPVRPRQACLDRPRPARYQAGPPGRPRRQLRPVRHRGGRRWC